MFYYDDDYAADCANKFDYSSEFVRQDASSIQWIHGASEIYLNNGVYLIHASSGFVIDGIIQFAEEIRKDWWKVISA